MNHAEINEAIAGEKGLDLDKRLLAEGKLIAANINGKRWDEVDYTKDPALNRELELELLKKDWRPYYDSFSDSYIWNHADERDVLDAFIPDKDFGIATATAWIKQFIGEL